MLDENYLIALVIGLVRQVTGFCKNTQKGIYDLEGGVREGFLKEVTVKLIRKGCVGVSRQRGEG